MAAVPTSQQSNQESDFIKIDVSSLPRMTEFPRAPRKMTPYPSPKNIEEFEWNYSATVENIKSALDVARQLIEKIDNYTNEHILKSEAFEIEEIKYGHIPAHTSGVMIELNKSMDPMGRGYKTIMFGDPSTAGLRSEIENSLDRYKNPQSGPAKAAKKVQDNPISKWVKIEDFNTVFTLMSHYNPSINGLTQSVDRAFQTLDNLDFETIPDNITRYYIEAIIEKVQATNSTKIRDTIRELDKIIDLAKSMHSAEFYISTIAKMLHRIFTTALVILNGNKKTMYAFLLYEFGQDRSDFEKIFTVDSIGSSTQKLISQGLKSKFNHTLRHGAAFDEKMSTLRKQARKQNTIIIDRGASDWHPRVPKKNSWMEYLATNKIDKKQYDETIESVAEKFSSFKTTEERYLIAIAMKMIMTNHGQYFLGRDDDDSPNTSMHPNGIYRYASRAVGADNGLYDSQTNTIRIEIEPDTEVINAFSDAFVRGYDMGTSPYDFGAVFKNTNPIKTFLNDALQNYIPTYLHIKEIGILAERAALLKQLLEDTDAIDGTAISDAFEGDYSGILKNGDTNIALAIKEYYDLLQTSSHKNIQNRYTPPSREEKIALEVLFSENELLQGNIGEQKKIFSLGITREAIAGTNRAPKTLHVKITKKDKLNPGIEFKPHTEKIDMLMFPVINGYKFFSTKLDDASIISTGGRPTSVASYVDFDDFVKRGMKFLDFSNISFKSSERTVTPQSVADITAGMTVLGKERNEKKLISSAKSHVLGIYLRSFFGTEFKGIDLDDLDVHREGGSNDDAWYDKNTEENYNKLYVDSNAEMSQRFKDIMLYNSTIFNKTKITNDVLYLHDIMYTYHVIVDVDNDFEQIGDHEYNPTKVLENIEFEVTSFFTSEVRDEIDEEIERGGI